MADIFISYARKDLSFVKKFTDALNALHKDAWVDLDGIYIGEEFWPRICSEIEAADTFVFVVSPDSVTSEYCRREINYAAKHNKRIIPIVYREVDGKAVSESLAKLNWLFFRESDDFENALQKLIKATDTDLDWVRAHTRLLVRARDWESHNFKGSYVLHGSDLKDSEDWLSRDAGKEPRPTSLQRNHRFAKP